jgi:hypothetical protein
VARSNRLFIHFHRVGIRRRDRAIRVRQMRSSLDFGRLPVEIIQMHHRNTVEQRRGNYTARPAARWTERPNPYRFRSCINVSHPRIDIRNALPMLSALIHRFLSPLQSATYLTAPACFGRLAKYWQQSKIRSSFNSDPPSYQHSTISWLRVTHGRTTGAYCTFEDPASSTFHFPDTLHVSSCVCPFTNRRSFTFSSNHVEARRAAHATLSSRVFCLSGFTHYRHVTFSVNINSRIYPPVELADDDPWYDYL